MLAANEGMDGGGHVKISAPVFGSSSYEGEEIDFGLLATYLFDDDGLGAGSKRKANAKGSPGTDKTKEAGKTSKNSKKQQLSRNSVSVESGLYLRTRKCLNSNPLARTISDPPPSFPPTNSPPSPTFQV